MRLLLSLAAVVLSITAVIIPVIDAAVEVEVICGENNGVNHRYSNAAARCVHHLANNGQDYAENYLCICSTSGVFKRDVASALLRSLGDSPCRHGQATDHRSGKFGSSTSHASVNCLGYDSIIPFWLIIPKPTKPEGGVLVTLFLLSESSEFTAVLQSDGNVVVKRKGKVFWALHSTPRSDGPFTAVLGRDGKFCVRNRNADDVACTPSRGDLGDYKLQLGDDGHLCVRGPNPWCTGVHI
ncbi:hypothetical protein K457DRAFT_131074 [Linnemannia elongata AG-77]|uniref:Bulb-type lectin domain-containing protein n=1 Tax=Linnemannia elongata AG-77 TaxID=1314771 RepID=A0A197JE25_9FUNG|nr:hypothetical protein K457DRAFT_131074 [Linnemannia elongata AG-77]